MKNKIKDGIYRNSQKKQSYDVFMIIDGASMLLDTFESLNEAAHHYRTMYAIIKGELVK